MIKFRVHSFILLLMIIGIVACKLSDAKVEIFEEGVLLESYEINEDSLRHGETFKFFSDGQIFEKSDYVNGELDGERLLFYPNGVVEIRENYCMGTFCDTLITYFKNGNRKFVGVYKEGVMNGIVKSYYKSGELKEEVLFRDNMEQGPFLEYHPNGKKKWEGTYLNGPNEIGELIEYDSTEVVIKKMSCDSLSICRTFWTLADGDINTL